MSGASNATPITGAPSVTIMPSTAPCSGRTEPFAATVKRVPAAIALSPAGNLHLHRPAVDDADALTRLGRSLVWYQPLASFGGPVIFGDKLSTSCHHAHDGLVWLRLRDLPQSWPGVEIGGCDGWDAHHVARLQGTFAGVDGEVGQQAAAA